MILSIVLNLDKIILWEFSLIRIPDHFDCPLSLPYCFIKNFINYGFSFNLPQILCGVDSLLILIPSSILYLFTSLFFSQFLNYLVHSILLIFIAFIGMYLLLTEEFKCKKEASFLTALLYSSIPEYIGAHQSLIGIPLLIYCIENFFYHIDVKKKLLLFIYILIYFFDSTISFIVYVIPFYITYFIFLSKIKKNKINIFLIFLIFLLLFFIQLPLIVAIYKNSFISHRMNWNDFTSINWYFAFKIFFKSIFNLSVISSLNVVIPSLLGLLIISFYILKVKCNKYLIFILSWIIFIYIISFFICNSPIYSSIIEKFSIFSSLNINRFQYILKFLNFLLLGLAINFLLNNKYEIRDKKLRVFSFIIILLWLLFYYLFNNNIYDLNECYIQIIAVLIFIGKILYIIFFNNNKNLYNFLLLIFVVFIIAINFYDKFFYVVDKFNYYNYYYSDQIEKIKRLENNNINNFRVVNIGGDTSQLLNNGFYTPEGYYNMYPLFYKEFWSKVIEKEMLNSLFIKDYFLKFGGRVYLFNNSQYEEIKQIRFNINLLKLISVKYIFSNVEILDYKEKALSKIFSVDPLYIKERLRKRLFQKRQFYIYQNSEYLQPLFITDKIKYFNADNELLTNLGNANFDCLKSYTFARNIDNYQTSYLNLNKFNSEILNFKLTPDYIKVNIKNENPVLINLTRNYSKNWRCKIDGVERCILRAYHSFMAVYVPANSRIIEFYYDANNYKKLFMISFFGIIMNIFLILKYSKQSLFIKF